MGVGSLADRVSSCRDAHSSVFCHRLRTGLKDFSKDDSCALITLRRILSHSDLESTGRPGMPSQRGASGFLRLMRRRLDTANVVT